MVLLGLFLEEWRDGLNCGAFHIDLALVSPRLSTPFAETLADFPRQLDFPTCLGTNKRFPTFYKCPNERARMLWRKTLVSGALWVDSCWIWDPPEELSRISSVGHPELPVASKTGGSGSHQSPELPQELIDLVIDQLAIDEELHALQACSLTASSWLPRTRSHLFGFLYLDPDNFAEQEERFLSSETAAYVRNLVIEGGTENDDEEPVPRDGELSQVLLALFTDVESVTLSHMRWSGLRPEVQTYFLSQLPRLTVLQLSDVEFPKLTELLSLAQSFSELREIHLIRVVWSADKSAVTRRAYSPSKAPFHLVDISVYECTSPAAFISSLLPPGYGAGLRRIALEWGEPEDPTILRNLIVNAGPSLRTLAIDLSWQGVY